MLHTLHKFVPLGRRQRAKELCLPSVPFPWSVAVHHRSLAFRARLYHAKNEAPEGEADFRPCDVTPLREPMTSWALAHVQTLSQPLSSSKRRELTRDWERAYSCIYMRSRKKAFGMQRRTKFILEKKVK